MSIPLKPVELENASLHARMAATQPGQITWVDLTSHNKCTACRHYSDGGKKQGKEMGFGRCALVRAHSKKAGPLFNGQIARACTKYEGRQ